MGGLLIRQVAVLGGDASGIVLQHAGEPGIAKIATIETERIVVGQKKNSQGKVVQKYVNVKTLIKDVVFEETHNNAMNVEPEP